MEQTGWVAPAHTHNRGGFVKKGARSCEHPLRDILLQQIVSKTLHDRAPISRGHPKKSRNQPLGRLLRILSATSQHPIQEGADDRLIHSGSLSRLVRSFSRPWTTIARANWTRHVKWTPFRVTSGSPSPPPITPVRGTSGFKVRGAIPTWVIRSESIEESGNGCPVNWQPAPTRVAGGLVSLSVSDASRLVYSVRQKLIPPACLPTSAVATVW